MEPGISRDERMGRAAKRTSEVAVGLIDALNTLRKAPTLPPLETDMSEWQTLRLRRGMVARFAPGPSRCGRHRPSVPIDFLLHRREVAVLLWRRQMGAV